MAELDEQRERRLHYLICTHALDDIPEIRGKLWKIEVARAKRYGRTEPIAVKVHFIWEKLMKLTEDITEVAYLLKKEGGS